MRRASVALLLSLVLFAFSNAAGATTFNLTAILDGAQANAGAGTGSSGTGSASMTFDDSTSLFTWSGSFTGLTDDFTVAHFHGPALPGANAGVALGFAVSLNPDNRSGTFAGSSTLSSGQATDLLAGLWYINIHSDFAPAGEIRGQVVPEPTTAGLLALGTLLLGLRRRHGS